MKKYEISIIDQGKLNKIFVRANTFLMKKYQDQISKSDNKIQTFENLWKEEFFAVLERSKSDNILEKIVFENNESMTMFLLRWS